MLNNKQIKLIQTAARAAGLRDGDDDSQYYLVLGQYLQSNRQKVNSCKQLTNYQMDDFLGICESMGWRCPGKTSNYYRLKARDDHASYAQRAAIKRLAEDLGWCMDDLKGFVWRMTNHRTSELAELFPLEAGEIIEALKDMFGRVAGKHFSTLSEIAEEMEATDGQSKQTCQA